jgi:hypothetical protein
VYWSTEFHSVFEVEPISSSFFFGLEFSDIGCEDLKCLLWLVDHGLDKFYWKWEDDRSEQ